MSTDVLPLPITDNEHPTTALKDRRRREPRDAAPSSTNPNTQEAHAEAQARSAAQPPAPEVRASDALPDAPAPQRNGEADTPARPSRISKPRAKGGPAGENGDDRPPRPPHGQVADTLLTRLALIWAAICIALSVVVLGISMPHLASGVSKITACQPLTAIFMAVVFDLSQIAGEGSLLVMPLLGIASRRNHLVCAVIIGASTLVSMTLNIRAFLEHVATPFETALAAAWGGLLPILVLLLVFVASSFLMRLHGPTASSPPSGT